MERDWQPIETAPTGIVVWTKIDDVHGARNEALLKLYRRLWWIPDGSQYVYYTPTHWAPKKTAPICEHQWDGERIPFGESGSVATCSRCGEAAVDLRLLGEQTPQRARNARTYQYRRFRNKRRRRSIIQPCNHIRNTSNPNLQNPTPSR